jgi:excisionase family DNA binding protein
MTRTPQSSNRPRLLTITEAAQLLRVSTRSIRRWIHDGILAAHHLGRQWRIDPEAIEEFLALRSNRRGRGVL